MKTENADNNMFGCNLDHFIKSIEGSVTYKLSGVGMVIAGLMSDAQEELDRGYTDSARKTLNRAKALLFQTMEGRHKLVVGPEGWSVVNT